MRLAATSLAAVLWIAAGPLARAQGPEEPEGEELPLEAPREPVAPEEPIEDLALAPPPAESPPEPAPVPEAPATPETPSIPAEPPARALGFTFGRVFAMNFDGHIRGTLTSITAGRFLGIPLGGDDAARRNPYYGRSDGFGLADARLNLSGSFKDLSFRLGFDGAFVSYESDEDVLGKFNTGLADAYLAYAFHPAAVLSVGRFKPPYDTEQLTPTGEQYFVHRSVESRGVERQEGYSGDMPGFRPGRHLGVQIASSDVLGDLVEGLKLGYAVAVTNGNREAAFNDNDLPAIYGRLQAGYAFSVGEAARDEALTAHREGPSTYGVTEGVFAGFSGFYDERTFGVPPNRQRDEVWGIGADIAARVYWFVLQGQFLYSETAHATFDPAPTEAAIGGHVLFAVELPWFGLAPGYRFAAYDPRVPKDLVTSGPDDELVMQHTIGLRWAVPELPLVALLDYTISVERPSRALPNDRLELAVQVDFE